MNDATNPLPQSTVFTGHEALLSHIQQHILDPSDVHALVIVSQDGFGKTAILQHLLSVLNESILPIYIPTADFATQDEAALWSWIVRATQQLLMDRSFTMSRMPELETVPERIERDWVRDVYLPQLMELIRTHRRLVWLWDDAHHLTAIDETLPDWLYQMMQSYPQLTHVLTMTSETSDDVEQLAPLADAEHVTRLSFLDVDEAGRLLRLYDPTLQDEPIKKIVRLTGGHPRLLVRYGRALSQSFTEDAGTVLQTVNEAVYRDSLQDFRQMWLRLQRNERLVLTAIASLLNQSSPPMIDAGMIQQWLIETDYPLDTTAIHAALRGLDYHDVIRNRPDGQITLIIGLMKSWLIDHARLDEDYSRPVSSRQNMGILLLAALLAGLILAIVLALPTPVQSPDSSPVPTITVRPIN